MSFVSYNFIDTSSGYCKYKIVVLTITEYTHSCFYSNAAKNISQVSATRSREPPGKISEGQLRISVKMSSPVIAPQSVKLKNHNMKKSSAI